MGKQHVRLIREKRLAKKAIKKEKVKRLGFVKNPQTSLKKGKKDVVVEEVKKPVDQLKERAGVRCVEPEEGMRVPNCPHGPCLLFVNKAGSKWFSCAVYRSTKLCDYKVELSADGKYEFEDAKPLYYNYGHGQARKLFETAKKTKKPLYWCERCFTYVDLPHKDPVEGPKKETELNLIGKLTNAKRSNAGEAQYWFSGNVLNVLATNLAKYDSVLAVGCPSAAEFLLNKGKKVFLLDYDYKFSNFFGPDQFAHFSLLAHHFYEADGQAQLQKFMGRAVRLALLVDPPFGAHVEALSRSLSVLHALFRQRNRAGELNTFVFLPVFVGKHLQDFRMLDYKVTYTNHGPYKDPRKTVVRIFTDVKHLNQFVLPAEEGYKLCKPCQRYVSSENVHCKKCKTCPTKYGPTYRHCDMCMRCVKPTYTHCTRCGKCHLPQRCGLKSE